MLKQMCTTMLCSAVFCSLVVGCQTSTPKLIGSTFDNKELTRASGVLENGLTYYVKENRYDEKKASLRLAVKVGSILEEEEERGLAHFLEHMVFRGTENYSDGEVIDYLESIGASFGADTNAQTSHDDTIYMFDIPLDKAGSLEKAISILSDFSMKALFAQEQLEVEKSVVLDELRLRLNSAGGRSANKLLELLLEGTLYAERHPIGLEEVIKNCTSEKMQNFYKKWYRPENMAVIAVGDFSKEEVMSYIHRYFGSLPASQEKITMVKPRMSAFNNSGIKIYKDPESTVSYFVLGRWIENNPLLTKEDFKNDVLDGLALKMANRRLFITSQESASPFQWAGMALLKWFHPATCFLHQSVCWDQEPLQALEALTVECEKMRHQDFTAEELEIACAGEKINCKVALDNADKHKNQEYAMKYLMHFTGRGSGLSFREEAQMYLSLLDEVELDEVNQRRHQLFQKEDQVTIFIPSAKTPAVSEEEIAHTLAHEVILEEESQRSQGTAQLALTTQWAPGSITEKLPFTKTGITKLVLSNGMKVYLEKTALKEHLISFTLKAPGGLNAYDPSLYPSAKVSCDYLQKSGLAGLSNVQLRDVLAGKHVQLGYKMNLGAREIQGEVANEDMETIFKLVHALFTERLYREDAWHQHMKFIDETVDLMNNNPDRKFQQDVHKFDYQDHYCVQTHNSSSMCKADAEQILEQAFKNPSEYTLVVSGDYEEESLLACLEKYLASIPSSSERFPEPLIKHLELSTGIHHRHLEYPSVGNESSVYWSSSLEKGKLEGSYQDFYQMELAKHIIQMRLLKKLRMEVGETYSVHCALSCPFAPELTSGQFIIFFPTSFASVERMQTLLLAEIQKIREIPPTTEEIDSAREIARHQHQQALQYNQGRVSRMLEQLDFGYELDSLLAQDECVVTQDSLHEIIKSLLNTTHYNLHIKLPK